MANKKQLVNVTVVSVTSPATIKRIAEEHGINPQEVFVRVGFQYDGKLYSSSNKLRFFGKEGYNKLLKVKDSGELVNLTVTANEKGTLIYLDSDEQVEVEDLFKKPVSVKDSRNDILDIFC